ICAPEQSCTPPSHWISGAKPKCTPRLKLPSLPLASKVAKAGNNPVRMRDVPVGAVPTAVPGLPTAPVESRCWYARNALTFPAHENDQPFDICIVRPCARADPASPSATHSNAPRTRFMSSLPDEGGKPRKDGRFSLEGNPPAIPAHEMLGRTCQEGS